MFPLWLKVRAAAVREKFLSDRTVPFLCCHAITIITIITITIIAITIIAITITAITIIAITQTDQSLVFHFYAAMQ